MTVETATYISDLNASYPDSRDPKSEGDDHIKLTKGVLRNSFPNISGAVTATHTQLSYVTGVTSAIQTQLDSKLPKAGGTMTGDLTINANATINGLLGATSALFGDASVYKSTNTAQRRIDFSHDSTLGYAAITVTANLSANLQPLRITTAFSSSPNIVVSENANAFNGTQTITGNVLHTGNYTTSGLVSATNGVTAKDSLLSATNTASSAKVYINDTSVVQDIPLSASTTRDLTIRGAYSASAPIPEGTVTIPSQLIAQSDIHATGSGKRFKADFSNATAANRLMFQTSTANSVTTVSALPSGTATQSGFECYGNSDPTNATRGTVTMLSTEMRIGANITGTGTYVPMYFLTGGSFRLKLDTDGTFTSVSGAIGYGTGAGGTVTQATSRTTGVTLNKPSGEITLVSAAGSASWQTFTLTNSFIASTDSVRCIQKSGTDKYQIHTTNIGSGTCQITFATTGGTTTEQPVFRFEVTKGATA